MRSMSRALRPSLILVFVVALLSGCMREEPIFNVPARTFAPSEPRPTQVEIEKRIVDAAFTAGWIAKSVKPGLLRAANRWGGRHTAYVDIAYDTNSYSIRYASSEFLLYKRAVGGQELIHRAYNQKVEQLARQISRDLGGPVPVAMAPSGNAPGAKLVAAPPIDLDKLDGTWNGVDGDVSIKLTIRGNSVSGLISLDATTIRNSEGSNRFDRFRGQIGEFGRFGAWTRTWSARIEGTFPNLQLWSSQIRGSPYWRPGANFVMTKANY